MAAMDREMEGSAASFVHCVDGIGIFRQDPLHLGDVSVPGALHDGLSRQEYRIAEEENQGKKDIGLDPHK
jgi:hypothetical protein